MEEIIFKIAENGTVGIVLAWALWRLQKTSDKLHNTLMDVIGNNTKAMNGLTSELNKRPCLIKDNK